MTAKEKDVLADLSVEVGKLTEKFEHFLEQFAQMWLDMYGVPGEKDKKPGVMGDVAELKNNSKYKCKVKLLVVRGVWLLVTGCAGAAVGAWVTSIL